MLHPKNIPTKTYEELMQENLGKIPIYSGEWTNYHPADPGITILENFTALQLIQQDQIEEIPVEVRRKLLELAGYRQRKDRSAEVWLEAEGVREAVELPAGQRFLAGDISFETTKHHRIDAGRITGVFRRTAGVTTDLSPVLNRNVTFCAEVFGEDDLEASALWLVMEEPPPEGEEKVVYAAVGGGEERTPFSDGADAFAKICWECLTEDGFVPMQVKDGTHGFLTDGFLRFMPPVGHRAVRVEEDGVSGYVWRARLIRGTYDVPPTLKYLSGFLFPVSQKETLAATYSFQQAADAVLHDAMSENGYIRVFAKREDGSYIAGEESALEAGRGHDAVMVVVYSEEMMRNYYLGDVFGYDRQQIELPKNHVVGSGFSVIAERKMPDKETVYDFLRPGRQAGQDMYYSLCGDEGKLVIHDPGIYVGAKLYLGGIAVTRGPEGNVRAGNLFTPMPPVCGGKIRFRNPAHGAGGRFAESFAETRRRFVNDLGRAETAVTPSDYETLVRRLPGLCIDKVHAWMEEDRQEVQIAVLPGSREAFPQLSEKYLRELKKWLDDRRLLTTGIRIRQPVYAAVLVRGTIYVKPHCDDCREQIAAAVRKVLDYVHGSMGFGERLRFDKVFHAIENVGCVSYIHELTVSPQNPAHVAVEGADILPEPDCLLYLGDCRLNIMPQTGSLGKRGGDG